MKRVLLALVLIFVAVAYFSSVNVETASQEEGVVTMDFKDTDPSFDFPEDTPFPFWG